MLSLGRMAEQIKLSDNLQLVTNELIKAVNTESNHVVLWGGVRVDYIALWSLLQFDEDEANKLIGTYSEEDHPVFTHYLEQIRKHGFFF